MPIKITKLNPKYIVFITIAIIILMVSSAYFEITSSQKETFKLLQEEAISLVQTINASSENAILSGNEIEMQVNSNLITTAAFIKNNLKTIDFQSNDIKKVFEFNKIELALITDIDGEIKNSNKNITQNLKQQIKKYIESITKEQSEEFPSGTLQNSEEEIYFIAQKLQLGSGYVFIGINSKYFLEFRKKIGIGSLFRNLTDQKEIEYVVLQDQEGILAASKNITELGSIKTDDFLGDAIKKDTTATRIFELNNKNIFEAVKPLIIESEYFGVVRVGISMESISSANDRMVRRIIIMAIVIAGIGVVLLSLLLINQHKNTLHTELKKLRSYNEKILENMADGVLATDHGGNLLFINSSAEKILNIKSSDVIGKTTNEIFKKNQLEEVIQHGKEIKSLEISLHDPVEKTIRLSVTFTLNEKGKDDVLAIIILQDITEEKKLHLQLQMNERLVAMGELAGGVAHEVRNPLNSISIIAQRLGLDFQPKEDHDSYSKLIKTIREEITRINKIVEQFLRFARKPKLILKRENISVVLFKAINIITAEAQLKNIQINKEITDEIIIDIDQDQILQALLNVLKNSIQAIEQNGKIDIKLKRLPNESLIEITDTGKGIEKQNLNKIFNLYYTTKPEGTGIGLSIVNQIISEHNGRIEVESKADNGTTVKIYLKNI